MSHPLKTLEIFPTPVFVSKAANLDNDALSQAVYRVMEEEVAASKGKSVEASLSNVGGYHTQDFLARSEFFPLMDFIVDVLNQNLLNGKWFAEKNIDRSFITGMWSVINRRGNSNISHNHPHAWFSGVYYAKIPKDKANSGAICFKDPNSVRQFSRNFYRSVQSELCSLQPETGNLVLFPGWLEHSVTANNTDEDRIAIAFNIKGHPIKY